MKNDKIDHPTKGSKDLSDATCGAIFNAIAYTPRESAEVHVKTIETLRKEVKMERPVENYDGVIRAPKKARDRQPDSLVDFLESMKVIGS
jgi:hypothetical protein